MSLRLILLVPLLAMAAACVEEDADSCADFCDKKMECFPQFFEDIDGYVEQCTVWCDGDFQGIPDDDRAEVQCEFECPTDESCGSFQSCTIACDDQEF